MRRLSFAGQMLALQIIVVLTVVAIATVTYGALTAAANRTAAQQTALTIARTMAQIPDVRTAVERIDRAGDAEFSPDIAAGPIQQQAIAIGERTHALFVVVTDSRGIRVAHPNPDQIGDRVSTDPSEALAGRETTSWETGTLGESARAKVPVFGADNRTVVGEVSVGFSAAGVLDTIEADLLGIVLVAALAIGVGIAASAVLTRRLGRLTLGLQPAEMAGLVQDQTAVISGIGEGVVGLAPDGRVTVCNDRAAHLLGLVDPVGSNIKTLPLPGQLANSIAARDSTGSMRVVHGERMLFIDVRRVHRNTSDLGTVVVVRDETDLESITRQLTAVSALSTALRVQRHEFANRLHVISGLLATTRYGQAREYLRGVLSHGPVNYPLEQSDLLTEPYLQAFLGAKGIEALERGVSLRIGAATFVRGSLVRPEETTTILGNLIDNAITAAVAGTREPRWVEVEALDDGDDLYLTVADSGDGIVSLGPLPPVGSPSAAVEANDPLQVRGLGFGLPLSRDLARRNGGDVWVASEGSPPGSVPGDGTESSGAVFCARLHGVVSPPGEHTPVPSPSPPINPEAAH